MLLLFPGHHLCLVSRGNKPANSPKGQPPDADGHSSVTDLANSLTGDMVMVSSSLPLDLPPGLDNRRRERS